MMAKWSPVQVHDVLGESVVYCLKHEVALFIAKRLHDAHKCRMLLAICYPHSWQKLQIQMDSVFFILKGILQRKLMWVESGVNK